MCSQFSDVFTLCQYVMDNSNNAALVSMVVVGRFRCLNRSSPISVLWIRDILVLIRSRIRGSPDPAQDPAISVIYLQDANKKVKKNYFFQVFCLLLFEGTHIIFYDKKS
jgi:hypothetical protein